jgi:hypothetical protein
MANVKGKIMETTKNPRSFLFYLAMVAWFVFMAIIAFFTITTNSLMSFLSTSAVVFAIAFFLHALIRKCLPKSGVVSFVIALLALAFYLGVDSIASRNIEASIAALRSKNYPLTADDLQKVYSPVKATDNGGSLAIAAANTLQAIWDDYRGRGEYFDLFDLEQKTPGNKCSDEELKRMEAFFDACAQPMQALEIALHMPRLQKRLSLHGGLRLIETELGHLSVLSACADVLCFKAFYHEQKGETVQAMAALQGVFRLADMLQEEPFLISRLVTIAIYNKGTGAVAHLLQQDQVSDAATLAELQNLVLPACQFSHRMFKYEIAFGYAVFEAKQEQGSPLFSLLGGTYSHQGELRMLAFYPYVWCKLDIAVYLAKMLELSEMLDQDENIVRDKMRHWQDPHIPFYCIATKLCFVQWPRVIMKEFASVTRARAMWAALAVKKTALTTGHMPESLAEIAKENALLVTDPCSGKPLQYKRLDAGYIIYGVAENWTDDGGEVEGGREAKDWGIRIGK